MDAIPQSALLALAGIGAAVVLCKLLALSSWFQTHFLTGKNNLRKYGAGKGAWAVVTGASGGIGKSFAVELARRKMNVVVMARSIDKLNALKEELASKYGVEARAAKVDFDVSDAADLEKQVQAAMAGIDVTILVNNVGVNIAYPEVFADHTAKDIQSMVNVNIMAAMTMTRLLLPRFTDNKNSRCAIVNVGSISGTLSTPMLSVYAATKAYIHSFSEALNREYVRKNVDVTAISPHFVISEMSKRRRATLDCPTPPAITGPTLNALGKQAFFSPYWYHSVIQFASLAAPRAFMQDKVFAMHKAVRGKAIKKFGERSKN